MALWICLSLVVISTLASSGAMHWDGFKAKFPGPQDTDGYSDLPQTAQDARKMGWVVVTDSAPLQGIESIMYCPKNDSHVCVHFEAYGYERVVGFHFALEQELLKQNYPYQSHPVFVEKELLGKPCYVVTFFFLPKDFSGTRSINSIGEGLWVQNGTDLVSLPVDEDSAEADRRFNRKICVSGMGLHYYYGLTKETIWTDFTPPFLLFDKGELIGCGVNTFGDTSKNTPYRETPPPEAIPNVLGVPPQGEFMDRVISDGWSSLHYYFVKRAKDISCDP